MRELDQENLNRYIQLKTNTKRIEELEIEDQKELIIFGKLKLRTSGYIIFIERNDPLKTDQIQFYKISN